MRGAQHRRTGGNAEGHGVQEAAGHGLAGAVVVAGAQFLGGQAGGGKPHPGGGDGGGQRIDRVDQLKEADARRAEIILNGLSADVVRSVENGKVWYRVVSGPYDSAEAAIIAQQTLQNSGIDSIVVKR